MPELPEVENVARSLARRLVGATVVDVSIPCEMSIGGPEPAAFARELTGRTFRGVRRRGKYLIFSLDRGYLVAHLRMTGQLLLRPCQEEEPRFARVRLALSDGNCLWFADMRKFGRLALTHDPEALLPALGPEPLDPRLDSTELRRRMAGRHRPVKSLLLDQGFLAGLGNIYADEALHLAGLHPLTPAGSVTEEQAESLLAAIREVLGRAIANRGTTFSSYVDGEGRRGENQFHLRVYGRAGEPCLNCSAEIAHLRLAGRSACFCPRCQPEAPAAEG